MPGTNSSRDPAGAGAIVIDPAVPPVARTVLMRKFRAAQRHPSTIPRRGALIPFRDSVPDAPPPPQPLRMTTTQAHLTLGSAIGFVVLLGGVLLAMAAGSLPAFAAMLALTVVAGGLGVRSGVAARAVGWTAEVADPQTILASDYDRWYERQTAAYYHRRYVVPGTDIDVAHRDEWGRAVAAADSIRTSYVLQSRLVDFEQVTAALPQRLWDIAAGFARLAEVRARQQDSARRAGSDDPYVSRKIAAQERHLELAHERLMSRVGELETLAGLIARADAAKQRELAVQQLGEVDDLLLDLLAHTSAVPGDEEQAERLRTEAEAVIEQAVEAAQRFALPSPDGEPPAGDAGA